jgi:hypothetical protein
MKATAQGHEGAIKALQQLDKLEGRTTPSFTSPKRCSACDTPEPSTRTLNKCPCFGAQYCNATCQTSDWKNHKKEHRRLCKEMKLKNTEGETKDEVVVEKEEGGRKERTSSLSLPQQQEEEDECPVCMEALQKNPAKYARIVCCGKGMHIWCYEGILSSLSKEQRNSCFLCRAEYPATREEQIEQLRPWVEKGKAWAQSRLGDKYRDGAGVDQSYPKAKELYELAASQGDAGAQINLGLLYDRGHGVDQSYEREKEHYEAAAKQGHAKAQYNLGGLYCNGQGVEQSCETARVWWVKAAEQGDENAIKALQELDNLEGRTTPSFTPKPVECATCFRPHDPPEHKLRPCKRCDRVYYCGRECQVKHWKKEGAHGHKQTCKKKLAHTCIGL